MDTSKPIVKTVMFLLDTSASMNTRTSVGKTLLDVARHTIARTVERVDKAVLSMPGVQVKYMLVTFDPDPVKALRVSQNDPPEAFLQELGNVSAHHRSNVSDSLTNAFRILNQNRLQSQTDTFGFGRRPWLLENAVVVFLSDGAAMTNEHTVVDAITWPPWTLQFEPFRWDQRLFSLSLRLPALQNGTLPDDLTNETAIGFSTNRDDMIPAMELYCKVTGGQSEISRTYSSAINFADVIVGAVKTRSVTISLQPTNDIHARPGESLVAGSLKARLHSKGIQNTQPKSVRMHLHAMTGTWPIPEGYWIDGDTTSENLPIRRACSIQFSTKPVKWQVEEYFFDKYAIDSFVYTDTILEMNNPDVCYQVFVHNSAQTEGIGYPFGFLKPSSKNDLVNLFVMPYNYPALFSIVDKCKKNPNATPMVKKELENYMNCVPLYYHNLLKTHLRRFNIERHISKNYTGNLPQAIGKRMSKLIAEERLACQQFAKDLSEYRLRQQVLEPQSHARRTRLQQIAGMAIDETDTTLPKWQDTPRADLLTRLSETVGRLYAQAEGMEVLKLESARHNVPCAQMGTESEAYRLAEMALKKNEFRKAKFTEDELRGKESRIFPQANSFADNKVGDDDMQISSLGTPLQRPQAPPEQPQPASEKSSAPAATPPRCPSEFELPLPITTQDRAANSDPNTDPDVDAGTNKDTTMADSSGTSTGTDGYSVPGTDGNGGVGAMTVDPAVEAVASHADPLHSKTSLAQTTAVATGSADHNAPSTTDMDTHTTNTTNTTNTTKALSEDVHADANRVASDEVRGVNDGKSDTDTPANAGTHTAEKSNGGNGRAQGGVQAKLKRGKPLDAGSGAMEALKKSVSHPPGEKGPVLSEKWATLSDSGVGSGTESTGVGDGGVVSGETQKNEGQAQQQAQQKQQPPQQQNAQAQQIRPQTQQVRPQQQQIRPQQQVRPQQQQIRPQQQQMRPQSQQVRPQSQQVRQQQQVARPQQQRPQQQQQQQQLRKTQGAPTAGTSTSTPTQRPPLKPTLKRPLTQAHPPRAPIAGGKRPMVKAGTALATGKTGTATAAATPAGAAPKKAYSAWDKLVSSAPSTTPRQPMVKRVRKSSPSIPNATSGVRPRPMMAPGAVRPGNPTMGSSMGPNNGPKSAPSMGGAKSASPAGDNNREIMRVIATEIEKPTPDTRKIINNLNVLQGNNYTKRMHVQDCIQRATRSSNPNLVALLSGILDSYK